VALPLFTAVFHWRQVYRSIFRFSGGRTIAQLASSVGFYSLPLLAIFLVWGVPGVPRTIAFLQPMLFFFFAALIRILARYALTDLLSAHGRTGRGKTVLVYGAGNAGQQLALSSAHDPNLTVLGFLDDDERLDGQRLDGVPIHHSGRLGELLETTQIDMILLAMPNLPRSRRAEIVHRLSRHHVEVMTLPDLQQIIDGKVSVSDLRQIQVADVLGRDAVQPNQILLARTVIGKVVMVTGAGGSIGSELCRQILTQRPSKLVLVEMTEHALFKIDSELRELRRHLDDSLDAPEIIPELLSVLDWDAVQRAFARYRPDTVFHAAAYKHVPLVEANPLSGLNNNVFGTLALAEAARRFEVARFILVSTDKAVRPTNIMGASKRICELVLQGCADTDASGKGGASTIFTMVRFGNVLGSSGSVVPHFEEQIRSGGPVTVTHRDVTRFFMTIPEAAQLVMQAGSMAVGGDVFVLDMGEPVRIVDLAKTMIELAGLTVRDEANPGGDIEIVEIGLRPGEKLYEELLIGTTREPTQHSQITRSAESFIPEPVLLATLERLQKAIAAGHRDEAVAVVRELVPEYAPRTDSGGGDVIAISA
jgi:FlaA1/EpsC-like NDP-sugar epimerase